MLPYQGVSGIQSRTKGSHAFSVSKSMQEELTNTIITFQHKEVPGIGKDSQIVKTN